MYGSVPIGIYICQRYIYIYVYIYVRDVITTQLGEHNWTQHSWTDSFSF
jgi:hypothetical protein